MSHIDIMDGSSPVHCVLTTQGRRALLSEPHAARRVAGRLRGRAAAECVDVVLSGGTRGGHAGAAGAVCVFQGADPHWDSAGPVWANKVQY